MRSDKRNSTPLPFTLPTTHPHQTHHHLQSPSFSKTNRNSFEWKQHIITSIQQLHLLLSTWIYWKNKPLCIKIEKKTIHYGKSRRMILVGVLYLLFLFLHFFFSSSSFSPLLSVSPFLTHLLSCIHYTTMFKSNCFI